MDNQIIVREGGREITIPKKSLDQLLHLARKAQPGTSLADINAANMEPVKTPVEKRIAKSKFNSLMDEMTDEQVKMVAFALCFDDKVQQAVQMRHKSVQHYTQVASIAYQLEKRGITITAPAPQEEPSETDLAELHDKHF